MPKRIYNQQALFGPLYAFLVVLSPPEEIRKDIAALKRVLNGIAAIGTRNLSSIGHITLCDQLTVDADFAVTIASLIKGEKPFRITVDGFGVFDHGPDKKTLYLSIRDHQPIIKIMDLVKSKTKFPHLSIAKNISATTLKSVIPELDRLRYSATWQCTEIVVLKKLMSEKHLGWRQKIVLKLDQHADET